MQQDQDQDTIPDDMSLDQSHFQIRLLSAQGSSSNPLQFLIRDQCSGHVVYLSGSELVITRTPLMKIDIGMNVPYLVQLSSRNEDLCAVLFTSNVLKIYHGSKSVSQYMFESVQVLAIYWIYTTLSTLLVITSTAFLFYNIDITNHNLNLIRAHTRPTIASWFLGTRRVLLAADVNNQFDLWIMRPAAPRKTLRFAIGRLKDATPDQIQRQIQLIDLYQHPTLTYFDENAGRLHVYLIQRSALVPTHSFDLFQTGPARLFVIDDVLVVFVEGRPQLPLLFDTRATNSPLISPLPLSVPMSWTILQPDLIVSDNQIVLLSLRLDGIIDSWGISDPVPLLHFLMRRSNSESHIKRVVYDQILQGRLSDQLCCSLSLLASSDSKRRSTIAQPGFVDIFRTCAIQVAGRYLESICFLYLQKLFESHICPESDLILFIVDILVKNQRYHQLQQCLQYHMFPDSTGLGQELCRIGRDLHDAIYQLGLDMLYRCGAHQKLIDEILTCSHPHRIILSLRFVSSRAQLIADLDVPRSNQLLQMMLLTGDHILFHNCFRWIQNRNLSVRGDENFVESDRCDEHVKLLIEQYGEFINKNE